MNNTRTMAGALLKVSAWYLVVLLHQILISDLPETPNRAKGFWVNQDLPYHHDCTEEPPLFSCHNLQVTTFKPGEINHCFYIFQISADSHTLVAPAEQHYCRNTAALMATALWDVYEYCKQELVWRGALTESIRMICEWHHMHGPHLLWVSPDFAHPSTPCRLGAGGA